MLTWLRDRLRPVSDLADAGNAVVEFVTIGVLMLVPVVYLVLTLGRVQAAAFAAEGAAREAARVFVTSSNEDTARQRAERSVAIALRDQGFDALDPGSGLLIECARTPCLQPDNEVHVRVQVEAVLPGVPRVIGTNLGTAVTVRSQSVAIVDRFRERP